MQEFIAITITILILLFAWLFVSFTIIGAVDSYLTTKKLSKFRQSILNSLNDTQPTWNQINLIAETQKLTKAEIGKVIKQLISDALTENDEKLKSNLNLLEGYLNSYKTEEPFDDLPDDVRLHLEKLREHLPDRIELLEPIVNHLRDLKTTAIRNKKRQRIIEVVSLIIGVAGFLVGLFPLFKR